jgi:hypothetical protein
MASSRFSAWAGTVSWSPTGISAVASDRRRDRAKPEIVDRDGVADNATVDPELAVGIGDVRHQRRGQAQRRRGDQQPAAQ